MKSSDPGTLIKQLILEKEMEQKLHGEQLRVHFNQTYESFKPINILKGTLNGALSSPGIKTTIINNVIGLASGFVVKRFFVGGSENKLKKLTGTILEMVVASKVSNNAEEIKIIAGIIFRKMTKQDLEPEKEIR